MDNTLHCLPKDITLDQLARSPIGEMFNKAATVIETVWNNLSALYEKQDELGMTGIKAATIIVFSVLRKIAAGKKPSEFEKEDWAEIAKAVSEYAVCSDDQFYSVFVFEMYEQYIRISVDLIKNDISEQNAHTIYALAEELHEKRDDLLNGNISEVAYIEDCLWLSLEAMIKLLSCTAVFFKDKRIEDFTQALASYAFEYGRFMLYSRELEIVNQYVESQYRLDAELERKYSAYMEDLQKETEQFYLLIDNAFAPDFRSAFLQSILLAKAVGLNEEEILTSCEEIDSFFLD